MAAEIEKIDESVQITNSESQQVCKQVRKRTRRLLDSIRGQIEFYLSDANLRKDRYLQNLLKSLGDNSTGTVFIPIKEFLKFNKIKSLTEDERCIARAVKSSQLLELNDTETEVRKKAAVNYHIDTDANTIYVEGLPAHADHSWIKSHFSRFGEIAYISLPCFKSNGAIKGFAFVEFKSFDSTVKVCKCFGTKIPDAVPYEPDTITDLEQNKSCKKRQNDEESEVVSGKKLKTDNVNTDKSLKEKTKKKNRRKMRDQCERVTLNDELEMKGLRVMSKQEWIEYKKKYIELQRTQMAAIKKSLVHNDENETKVSSQACADTKHGAQNENIVTGVVLKMTYRVKSGDEFIESVFRRNIREVCGDSVAYIDVLNEAIAINSDYCERICYIRFRNAEIAEKVLLDECLSKLGIVEKLSNMEEKEYSNRIHDCLNKKKTRERQKRGVHRVTERMDESVATKVHSKVNTHIKFE